MFHLQQIILGNVFDLSDGCVPSEVGIKYAKEDVRRMMAYFMQPLALSEKTIGQFFNDNIQEYAFPVDRVIFLLFLCNLLVIHEDGDDVITNHSFKMAIMSEHILVELSN